MKEKKPALLTGWAHLRRGVCLKNVTRFVTSCSFQIVTRYANHFFKKNVAAFVASKKKIIRFIISHFFGKIIYK